MCLVVRLIITSPACLKSYHILVSIFFVHRQDDRRISSTS